MKAIKYLVAILISIALAACGGGSSAPPPAPAPTTYSISGSITGASGVAVALAGASTASATTDASGNYSFTGLANGSYSVTPTKSGNIFTPSSLAVTVSGANIGAQNFTATASTAITYSISGAVSGAITSGVTITLSGSAGSTVTGTGGAYSISGLPTGNYTITPSLAGYTFAPTSLTITALAANSITNNFVATLIPVAHALTGNVSPTLAGVTITAVNGATTVTGTTDASGNYSVNLFDGTYTVTPSLTNYLFAPNNATVTMAGAAKTQNFAGTSNSSVKATANGTVTGSWVEGVTITASGTGLPTPLPTATTNASGNYSISNLPSGQTYTFTPTLAGYTFGAAPTASIPAGSATAVTVPAITATSAVTSYIISGTVAYAGTKTGGIMVQALNAGCPTCSVAATTIAAPGAYTLRGLQPGNYVIVAEMDAQGSGQGNANNPISSTISPPAANITNASLTGVNVAMTDPAAPTIAAPTGLSVAPGNGVGLVVYTPAVDANNQEIATGYNLTWGTGSAATGSGTQFFPAQGVNQTVYMLSGLTNGTYNFQLTACLGGTSPKTSCAGATTAPSTVLTGVVIGATSGANTVTGTVNFSGAAASTAPLYVIVHNNGGGGTPFVGFVQRIAPQVSSGATFSIAGVPTGTWKITAIVDQNNNGLIDAGDIGNANGNSPSVAVPAAAQTLTLSGANAVAQIGTDYQSTGNYSINSGVGDGVKRVVSATMFSGPNVAVPTDMNYQGGQFNFNNYNFIGTAVPVVGDTYQFKVAYSDGTSGIISAPVTAVLTAAQLATAVTVANPTSATPIFNWGAPSAPPTSYLYTLNVYPSGGGTSWYYPANSNGMPSTTVSLTYGVAGGSPNPAPALGAAGTCMSVTGPCAYGLQVKDANSLNTATYYSTFIH